MILVIFDIDGTLVYSNKVDSQCFADTYKAIYDLDFPSIDWRQYPHVTDHVIFNTAIAKHFGRQADEEERHYFQDHFVEKIAAMRAAAPDEFLEVPNARSLVNRLLEDGRFAVGIGTGGWLRPAKLKLEHVGIPVEKLHLSAADGQPTRQHILNHAISLAERAHGNLDRVVYVGDAVWDVETTREMGLPFIGIRREGDLDALRAMGAEVVLKDFSDEQKFLDAVVSAMPPKGY